MPQSKNAAPVGASQHAMRDRARHQHRSSPLSLLPAANPKKGRNRHQLPPIGRSELVEHGAMHRVHHTAGQMRWQGVVVTLV